MTTAGSPVLGTAAYLEQLRGEGARLAASAAPLDLGLAVPACPGWVLRDLLRHVGYVHRWATGYVTGPHTERVPRLDEPAILAQDVPDVVLLDWFRTGHAGLVSALEAAGPGLDCWTFLPGAASPLDFWARRQAHETTVHRVNVQQAAASTPACWARPVPAALAALAADGIDELLMGFARRSARHGPLADPPCNLFIQVADGYQWLARMGPERAELARGWAGLAPGPRDCTLSGPAAAVYLLLWNRHDVGEVSGLRLAGDLGVLRRWQRGVRVTWG